MAEVEARGFREPVPQDVAEVCTFAFGANMSVDSLRNRGIESLRQERGKLLHHELVFNVASTVKFDGDSRFGNVAEREGSVVHGVVHWVHPKGIAILDQMEGTAYDRISREVELYDGTKLSALIFIQTKSFTDGPLLPGLPSKRYLKLLTHGAKCANLDPSWIRFLEQHDFVHPPVLHLTDEQKSQIASKKWDSQQFSVSNHGQFATTTATDLIFVVYGVVFGARPNIDPFIRRFLVGDVSLRMCGMVSYDPKPESILEATPDQVEFLRTLIHQFLQEGLADILGHCDPCPLLLE
eukprot:c5853_g1_i1.p1 GENE.c5853_g1_i1~~c5853_g1_i1.p1  ORF type:complete len:295 (+),score=49.89 c5853_g1_i1:23-907(+)